VKFDIIPGNVIDWGGQNFLALFGDEPPMTASLGPRAGRAVIRIDPTDWNMYSFVTAPLTRPIDVRFNPVDKSLYVLDFGVFEIIPNNRLHTRVNSGTLWRVS
jgi:hypothetical protein